MTTATARTWTDDEVAQLLAIAYDAGIWAERQRHIDDLVEMRLRWADRPLIPRVTPDQRHAQRLAHWEGCARDLAADTGRPAGYVGSGSYRGGPVDWDTGAPLRTPLTVVQEAA